MPTNAALSVDVIEQFDKRRQHAMNKISWHVPATVTHGRFLDIGCGVGNGVLAALQCDFSLSVGIDRDFGEFTWFKPRYFDSLCCHYGVDCSKALLIEGDVFSTHFVKNSFDCVMMLDSIEHVPSPERFIELAASYVAPGGVFIMDTCPLYYSKMGGHLWGVIPPDLYPWAHLRHDLDELLERYKVDSWTLQRYQELNKTTHETIRNAFLTNKLEIIQEERNPPSEEDIALFEKNRQDLNLESLPYDAAIFEDWILLVGQKPK